MISWIKKYWHACIIVVALAILAVVSVMGWHWTETARTPFWWTFWVVAAIIAVPGFIGLILWAGKSKSK